MEWFVVCVGCAFGLGWIIRGAFIRAEVARLVKRSTCPGHEWGPWKGNRTPFRCVNCGAWGDRETDPEKPGMFWIRARPIS